MSLQEWLLNMHLKKERQTRRMQTKRREVWKHRKKKDFYRVMEIMSVGFMGYGGLQLAAVEEMVKVIPATETTMTVMGIIMGILIIILGAISRRLFRGLRIMESKEWREDEKRVHQRAS